MAEGDLADRLVTYALKPRTIAWRIYEDVWGPLAPHPNPPGRMALLQDVPPGTLGRGGIWLSSTPGGACWEAILRDLQPRGGRLYLPRARLVGRSLVKLRARAEVPLVDLREPGLRALFDGRDEASWARVKALWHLILQSADHTQSHHAAAELAALAARQGKPFAGCTWKSAQDQGADVHLLYAPPYAQDWDLEDPIIALTSAEGVAALRDAASRAHMALVLTGGIPFPCEADDP